MLASGEIRKEFEGPLISTDPFELRQLADRNDLSFSR